MPKPICPDCGDRHEKYQAHIWPATNTNATNRVATNTKAGEVGRGSTDKEVDRKTGVVRTLNRRSREAYNAYQREYMRKKRAKAV